MKSQLSKFYILSVLLVALAIIHAVRIDSNGQSLENTDIPPSVTSFYTVGEPERVNLDNGKYKLVHKNKDGQPIVVLEYAPVGSMIQLMRLVKRTELKSSLDYGKSISVKVTTFEENPNNINDARIKASGSFIYNDGVLIKKSTFKVENGQIDYGSRTVTRYTPGGDPNGTTQKEKLDANLMWIKDSPFTGKWYVEKDGKRQTGDVTIVETPGSPLMEIRYDSITWVLMFSPLAEKRSVALPASSRDVLGFSGRLIQLRGNADAGRLEFWLTPDLLNPEFQRSNFVLVREDN